MSVCCRPQSEAGLTLPSHFYVIAMKCADDSRHHGPCCSSPEDTDVFAVILRHKPDIDNWLVGDDVTPDRVSITTKCHSPQSVTQHKVSITTKSHSTQSVTQHKVSLNTKCHSTQSVRIAKILFLLGANF